MIGIGLNIGNRVIVSGGYDPDAQAFFDRVATAGGTLTTTEKNATNQLVLDMKSAGIWTSMKAVYPMVGASANLLSYTEDFGNAFWSKLRTSVTSNATIAPDGTLTADALFETAVNDFHGLENANAITLINGSTYTQSIYVKPIGRRYIALTTQWGGGTLGAWFDTQNVVVYSTDSGVTANITTANNGFYRITITRTSPATNGYMNIWYDDSTPTAGVYYSGNAYLGDVTKGFYLWGAQLELASTATTYIPVLGNRTTEAAAACAQNLVSSSFTGTFSSGWTFASTGVTPNGTSAYMDNGLNDLLDMSNSSNSIGFYSRTNNSLSNCNDIGAFDGSNFTGLRYNNNGSTSFAHNGIDGASGAFVGFTSLLSSAAFLTQSRTSVNSFKFIRNGVVLASTTNTKTGTNANKTFYIGATNGPSGAQQYSDRQFAFAYFSDGLTDTQASNFYTAVQTFNQTLNRQVGAQIVSDADAQAYINRVYTAGGTLTNTEANAVNQLVIDMKAAGIWTAMKAVYPMVGASAAACAQNLKSSSFTGTFSSGWTFASTGVTGNGTSSYFDTTFKPSSDASLSGFSFGGYLRLNLTTPVQVDGVTTASTSPFAQHNFVSANMFSGDITNIISYTGNPSQRMFVHRRTSASFAESYRNSTSLGTNTVTASGLPSGNYYIGARNDGSSGIVLYTSQQYAFYFFGLSLTNQNALDLTTAVNTFQTTLSRQV